MRDSPVHSFIQVMTGQIHDQLALGPYDPLVVIEAWVLFFGGLAIASYVWRAMPAQRTATHLATFLLRFTFAGLWYLGTLWKLPWPVSHGFREWLTNTVTYSSFGWHAAIMQLFLDHIAVVQPLVYLAETFFAVAMAFGLFVRLAGVLAALFVLNLLVGLYNDPTEWVWTYVGIIGAHGMFAAWHAGRSLGLDALLRERRIFAPGSRAAALVELAS